MCEAVTLPPSAHLPYEFELRDREGLQFIFRSELPINLLLTNTSDYDAWRRAEPDLLTFVAEQASGVQLRFVQKPDKDSAPLRDGTVDLETGVLTATTAPELRAQALFRDHFVGVVRTKHPLSDAPITPASYSAGGHICVSRRGILRGPSEEEAPIDEALQLLGLERRIVTIVGGFSAAVGLARHADLIASVPERHTAGLRSGMTTFRLPISTPDFTVSLLWHPRLDADPAHRWLRECVRQVCAAGFSEAPDKAVPMD